MSHNIAVGSDASPEEENLVTHDQSLLSVVFSEYQDLTREGTTPSMLIRAFSTNLQNRSVEVIPPKRAIVAPLIS